jgi:two-component system sensor histidine kinase HydH
MARKILLVEDMPDQRVLIQTVFKAAGEYDFEEIPDGSAAMDWVHAHPDGDGADLILLDHRMPGFSGLEVLGELRRKDKATPVIFMTAENSAQLTVEAMRLGISDFIIKEGAFQMLLPEVAKRVLEKIDIQTRLDQAETASQFQSAKSANLGQILSEVLHELKGPMKTMGNTLAEIKQTPGPDRAGLMDESLGGLTRGIERSQHIIDNLMEFSRPKDYTFTKSDLPALIQEVLSHLKGRCDRQKIATTLRVAEKFPKTKFDAQHVKGALLRVLINAIEAMPDGGSLNVELRDLPKDEAVEIEITDTGQGIPEEDQLRLFEKHFTTKVRGTGLGLLLTHQVVYQHRGTVRFKSAVGEGSTFTLRFPYDPPTR